MKSEIILGEYGSASQTYYGYCTMTSSFLDVGIPFEPKHVVLWYNYSSSTRGLFYIDFENSKAIRFGLPAEWTSMDGTEDFASWNNSLFKIENGKFYFKGDGNYGKTRIFACA